MSPPFNFLSLPIFLSEVLVPRAMTSRYSILLESNADMPGLRFDRVCTEGRGRESDQRDIRNNVLGADDPHVSPYFS